MGTRALARVKDESGKTLLTLYIHYDGYPEGALLWPLSVLANKRYSNGIQDPILTINGMDDFAAQLVALLKLQDIATHLRFNKKLSEKLSETKISDPESIIELMASGLPAGNVYAVPEDTRNVWQEYEYEFYPKDGTVFVRANKLDVRLRRVAQDREELAPTMVTIFEGSIADYVATFSEKKSEETVSVSSSPQEREEGERRVSAKA